MAYPMADLATLADLADVVGAAVVVGGVAFAVVQLRQYRRQREDTGAFTVLQQWADAESLKALDAVYALPDSAPAEIVEAANARGEVTKIYNRLELMGMMVHARMLPISTANEWAGGAVRVSWRKLRPWIEGKRTSIGSERPGEWFQWLAERFDDLPARDEKTGAHVAHRDWKP